MSQVVPKPSAETIHKYLSVWETLEKYRLSEGALGRLFHELCPENSGIESVLLKVSALNDFYSTNIYDTYTVGKHILALDIDDRLRDKDLRLVNDIAKVNIKGKSKNFYSFATKYCSHHEPDAYPIYDSFVDTMLRYYRNEDAFEKFRNAELRDYPRFIEIITSLREYYGVTEFSLRDLDIFLWLAGKEHFPRTY